jgi:hypothetical protein
VGKVGLATNSHRNYPRVFAAYPNGYHGAEWVLAIDAYIVKRPSNFHGRFFILFTEIYFAL